MRRKRRFERPPSGVGFNFTPLIDVMFLLTIFFMLVAKFTSAEQVPVELPHPQNSQAQVPRATDRVVINCRVSDPDDPDAAATFSVGPNPPEPLTTLSDRLAGMKRETPRMKVILRADRRLPYGDVRALMRVVAANQIDVLNVAAIAAESD